MQTSIIQKVLSISHSSSLKTFLTTSWLPLALSSKHFFGCMNHCKRLLQRTYNPCLHLNNPFTIFIPQPPTTCVYLVLLLPHGWEILPFMLLGYGTLFPTYLKIFSLAKPLRVWVENYSFPIFLSKLSTLGIQDPKRDLWTHFFIK